MHSQQMISTHPDVRGNYSQPLIKCIDDCFDCAQTCISCADACVAEPMVENLRQCIRFNLDCADICHAAGALASRRTGSNEEVLRQMLELCQLACQTCAAECEQHAQEHEHCLVCAEQCRECEESCRLAVRVIGQSQNSKTN